MREFENAKYGQDSDEDSEDDIADNDDSDIADNDSDIADNDSTEDMSEEETAEEDEAEEDEEGIVVVEMDDLQALSQAPISTASPNAQPAPALSGEPQLLLEGLTQAHSQASVHAPPQPLISTALSSAAPAPLLSGAPQRSLGLMQAHSQAPSQPPISTVLSSAAPAPPQSRAPQLSLEGLKQAQSQAPLQALSQSSSQAQLLQEAIPTKPKEKLAYLAKTMNIDFNEKNIRTGDAREVAKMQVVCINEKDRVKEKIVNYERDYFDKNGCFPELKQNEIFKCELKKLKMLNEMIRLISNI